MDVKNNSFITIIAGIFLLLSGVFAILAWLTLLPNENYFFYGIIGIILAVFPIIAGILTFKKIFWNVALICSIIGLFTILTPIILSAIFASLGFILLVISKKDFS